MTRADAIRSEAVSLLESPENDTLLVGFNPGMVPSPEELISFFNTVGGMSRLYLFTPSLSRSGRGAVYTKFNNTELCSITTVPTNAVSESVDMDLEEDGEGTDLEGIAVVMERAELVNPALVGGAPQTSPGPSLPQTSHSKKRKTVEGGHITEHTETMSVPENSKKRKKIKGSISEDVRQNTWDDIETVAAATTTETASMDINEPRGYSPSVPLPFSNIVTERIKALYGDFDEINLGTITVKSSQVLEGKRNGPRDEKKERRKKDKGHRTKRDGDIDHNDGHPKDRTNNLPTIIVPTGIMSDSSSTPAQMLPDAVSQSITRMHLLTNAAETNVQEAERMSKRSKKRHEKRAAEKVSGDLNEAASEDVKLQVTVAIPEMMGLPEPNDPVEKPKEHKSKDTLDSEGTAVGLDKEQQAKKKKKRKHRDAVKVSSILTPKALDGATEDANQGADTSAPTKVKKPKKKKSKDATVS
ncbi:hypothetical protein FRB94_010785 [Tulasnella sp. JGI-2019a]|nr:hypothetical protein FRB94_010785 [Tulasnella sp. JGI-2019a]KAG9035898.1 hypothetical protein FRB95_010301 [Tulasnella sp. JGI-2019a]